MSNEAARDFLAAVSGYTIDADGPKSSADRPIRLATIHSSYGGTGNARVTFDGETTATGKSFVIMAPVAVGDRVVMLPVGQGYVILGKLGGVIPAVGYLPRQILVLTGSTTFAKASYPWLTALRVRVVGGGGAGGGAPATGAGVYSNGTGGGGGGYAEKFIADIAGLASSVTVTIGAGGAAASGTTGGAGGASSFGAAVAAGGGGGGAFKPANVFSPYVSAPAGGVGTAGDLLLAGQGGTIGAGSDTLGSGGSGGSSQLGGGAPGVGNGSTGAAGVAGGNYGGGGSGAFNSSGQSARSGGAGAPGLVIVELFA